VRLDGRGSNRGGGGRPPTSEPRRASPLGVPVGRPSQRRARGSGLRTRISTADR
jgi:hypothetical protein